MFVQRRERPAGSLAAIGLSGRVAAEQIGTLIEGVEEAGAAARPPATES